METTIYTPRLKLTLVTTAERGSREFEWLHELRSDEKVTWWSIHGRSKSPEETEKVIKHILPVPDLADGQKVYRVVYLVHEILETADKQSDQKDAPTRLAGSITIRSRGPNDLPIPSSMFPSLSAPSSTTLNAELGYQFLPSAWGKGFATESVSAVFEACRRASSFWTPFQNVYVRALVNAENPASLRVMAKSGMEERGVYVWTGEPVYLAGEWRGKGDLHIFGMYLKGGENM